MYYNINIYIITFNFNIMRRKSVLIIRKLNKIINNRKILSDISLEFNEGQIYPIIGKNGSGKTTLFQCISGDLKYESGDITIKEGCKTMLAHKHGLLPVNLTGYQFMQFICENVEQKVESIDALIDETFKTVKFDEETRHTLIKEYDFISKKKLQLAQFLVQKPYVIMFDEPFDYRDETYIKEFLKVLISCKEDHIILVSTGLLDIAKMMSKDLIILDAGKANVFSKENLRKKANKKAVLELMGDDDGELH